MVIHTARLQLPYERHDADLCALLRSGKNVITTAGQHYPAAHGAARLAMFESAARDGGATLYGTGMNPGYVLERLVLGLTGGCTDVRRIEVTGRGRAGPPGGARRARPGGSGDGELGAG